MPVVKRLPLIIKPDKRAANYQKTDYMKKNMGNADRAIRIVLAVVFGALYFTGTVTGTFGYVLLGLGAVFVLTSLVSFCPLYSLVGLNTCPTKKA
jgi:Protein of unknown function (DUF2892)